jgi:hypothetical protein
MSTASNSNGQNGSSLSKSKQEVTESTPAWVPAFLAALEETGVILKAAAAADISRKTVWLRRKNNSEFAQDFDDALRAGALLLEAEAIRRAQDGVVRMKFNPKTGLPYIDPRTGEPYMEHEYSDTLMAILLKRHFPEYREPKGDVNVTSSVHNHLHITESDLKQLQAERQRFLTGEAK